MSHTRPDYLLNLNKDSPVKFPLALYLSQSKIGFVTLIFKDETMVDVHGLCMLVVEGIMKASTYMARMVAPIKDNVVIK